MWTSIAKTAKDFRVIIRKIAKFGTKKVEYFGAIYS